jgi:hypothetical protein
MKVMTTNLVTQSLQTHDITLMTNATSLTLQGTKVSRVGPLPREGEPTTASIYIDFVVKHPSHGAGLDEAEEVSLSLQAQDAVQVGLSLLALALEPATPEAIAAWVVQAIAKDSC